MLINITAGNGPYEAGMAVLKLADALMNEFNGTSLVTTYGDQCSLLLEGPDKNLASAAGTVCWISPSPIRPNSKPRKWYVQVRVVPTLEELKEDLSNFEVTTFKAPEQLEGMKDYGVRLTHKPSGLVVESFEEEDKEENKEIAFARMRVLLDERAHPEIANEEYPFAGATSQKPVRMYTGLGFSRG